MDDAVRRDDELATTRLLDAPRERVFRAFSEAEHLAQWWGPNGFTNTFHEFDLRTGATWRYTMHGPNGADFLNESAFVEVLAPQRIVIEHDRALAAVDVVEHRAHAGQERRPPAARVVAALGPLDLHHVGAQAGQRLARERPREILRELEHLDAGERKGDHRRRW